MKKNRIALIGCGEWGKFILRDLVTLGCEVHVVARSRQSKQRAKNYGAKHLYNELSELPLVDGVVVATPSKSHTQVVHRILDKNPDMKIFCEKPLSITSKDAESLYKRAPKNLFIMDKWRYHPGILALADLAKSKKYGKLLSMKLTRNSWIIPHDDADPIWHLMPHDLSIVYEILGTFPEPRFATADIVRGKAMGLFAILGKKPWVHIELSARYSSHFREIVLYFEDAVAFLGDAYADSIHIFHTKNLGQREKPKTTSIKISKEMPLFLELKAFVEYLNGAPSPKSSALEGLANVKMIVRTRKLAGLK